MIQRQQPFLWICITLLCGLWHAVATAGTLSLPGIPPGQALGAYTSTLRETGAPLALEQAMQRDRAGEFAAGSSPILTFGIGVAPAWVKLSIDNPGEASIHRQLRVETSWLDVLDVYFVKDGRTVASYRAGDRRPFGERPVSGRFFAFEHGFAPGATDIYLRVETDDPLVVPLFLLSPDEAAERKVAQGYSYGFLYGYLLALLAYNLFIYLGLRHKRHLLYAGFIGVFVLTNLAYTGHGYAWLWPGHPDLQRWIIPVLMVLYGISGLTFAKHFLDTRAHFPRTQRLVTWLCGLTLLLLGLAVMAGSQFAALLSAFVFVIFFSSAMLALGWMSFLSGYRYSRFFLFASIASMLGTGITTLSVWGFIAFNDWTYRAVEIGMLIDATLLALALADQLRSIQLERKLAEELAASDPLTGLNNRRSFLEKAQHVWRSAQRNGRDLSVIILDIDHFKSINDRFGHAAGDEALIALGRVLSGSARQEDIIARWGGEEFLLLLPETPLDAALVLAERLRKAISEARTTVLGVPLTASFGVAHIAGHALLDDLIAEADSHLYQSKKRGRDRISSRLG